MIRRERNGDISISLPKQIPDYEQKVVVYAAYNYGFILNRNTTVTYEQFAGMIAHVYAVSQELYDTPDVNRTAEVVRVLTSIK